MNSAEKVALKHDLYLKSHYKDKDSIKILGGRWDGKRMQWFIPSGLDIAPFTKWISEPVKQSPKRSDNEKPEAGLSLTSLMAKAAFAIERVLPDTYLLRADIGNFKQLNSGTVILDLVENDANGNPIAEAKGIIWPNKSAELLKKFEEGTGEELKKDIKVLLEVSVKFQARYGFQLIIQDIDPSFTVGDAAIKIKQIIHRLTDEKLINKNRFLPAPVDFFHVIVVSPGDAAGLGDFQQDAAKLAHHGLCMFEYRHALFQGDLAANDLTDVLEKINNETIQKSVKADAVIVIRGGGAPHDLGYVNDYSIAKAICACPVPVIVGIGHDKDMTVLDQVARTSLSTPSYVIKHIREIITDNAYRGIRAWTAIQNRIKIHISEEKRSVGEPWGRVQDSFQAASRYAERRSTDLYNRILDMTRHNVNSKREYAIIIFQGLQNKFNKTLYSLREAVSRGKNRIIRSAEQRVFHLHRYVKDKADAVSVMMREQIHEQEKSAETAFMAVQNKGISLIVCQRELINKWFTLIEGQKQNKETQIKMRQEAQKKIIIAITITLIVMLTIGFIAWYYLIRR